MSVGKYGFDCLKNLSNGLSSINLREENKIEQHYLQSEVKISIEGKGEQEFTFLTLFFEP